VSWVFPHHGTLAFPLNSVPDWKYYVCVPGAMLYLVPKHSPGPVVHPALHSVKNPAIKTIVSKRKGDQSKISFGNLCMDSFLRRRFHNLSGGAEDLQLVVVCSTYREPRLVLVEVQVGDAVSEATMHEDTE
jgi:hypothetical protein